MGCFLGSHCDALCTPVAMTNMQGNVVWRGNSLPFGEEFSGSGKRDTEIRYTGKPYNPNLGLYDLGARYYDPNVGRFTGVDPIQGDISDPQRLNSYAYCLNSPYKYVDPDGQYAIEIGAFIVGALLFGGYLATHHGQAPDLSFANPFVKVVPYEENQAQTSGVAGGAPNPFGEQPGGNKDKLAKKSSKEPQVTKSNLKQGQQTHKMYKADLNNPAKGLYKEFRGIKGIRPDFVDFNTRTIYELKPNNPRAIREGLMQLDKYRTTFQQQYGGQWNVVLDTY